MMHPHHLHALTAAWTLHAARQRLASLIADRRHIDAQLVDTRDGLRSSALGRRTALGGHGDPVPGVALLGDVARDELGDVARSVADTLRWLAHELTVPYAGDPLPALIAAIPARWPATADQLARWLGEADRKIRDAIGCPEQLTAWPGDCPACGQRLLELHTAAPRPQWTVTCSARDCVCAGDACPCRMPVRAVGVAHIWLRSVIVAPANAETRKAA